MTSADIKQAEYQKIKHIISEYLQLSDYAQPTFLNQVAAQYPQLIDTIKSMIGFQDQDESFILDTLPIDLDRSAEVDASLFSTDDQEKFTVHNKLGYGGYSQVYQAQQLAPIRRKVAIKFLNRLPKQSLLLAEAEFLANLNHPNIATLYECGETRDERLFIVMELVSGTDLISHADQQQLNTADKIALFKQLCLGVAHAHEKGIIHCDIKPNNVLVTEVNGQPVVKIIDFGVSKYQRLSEDESSISGTPAFMAPETLNRKELLVDTRNDVYAMGVLLHRLLYGAMPDFKTVNKNHVNADLQAIIACAMHSNREQRYSNSIELFDDLNRHLNHEVVKARNSNVMYRCGRFLLRNKIAVMVFVAMILTIGAGYYAQSVQAIAAKNAQIESEKVTDFVIDLLSTVDPEGVGDKQSTPELVLQAKKQLLALPKPTQTDARFMYTVAEMLYRLDKQSEALALAKKSLDIRQKNHSNDKVALLDNLTQLAKIHRKLRQFEDAKDVLLQAVNIEEQDDPRQLSFIHNQLGNLYFDLKNNERSIMHHKLALDYRQQVGDEKLIADSLNNIGAQYYDMKQWRQSGEYFQQSLKLLKQAYGPDHAYTYYVINNLATIEEKQFNWTMAEQRFKQAVAGLKKIYGPQHFNSTRSQTNLARYYVRTERFNDAIMQFNEVLEQYNKNEDDYNRMRLLTFLADARAKNNQFDLSKNHYEQALNIGQNMQPINHFAMALVKLYYGKTLQEHHQYKLAEKMLNEVLLHEMQHDKGYYHYQLRAINLLAQLAYKQNDWATAENFYQKVLAADGINNTIKKNIIVQSHIGLSAVLQSQGNFEQATHHLQRAYDMNVKILGEYSKVSGEIINLQGDLYLAMSKVDLAHKTHQQALKVLQHVLPKNHSAISHIEDKLNKN